MKKDNRRPILKRFWSNQGFQARYSLLVVTITTLITLVFSYLYYKNEMITTEILGIQNNELLDMIQGNDHKLIVYLVGFFVFQFLMVFVIGVLLTHKVAGPLYRMERYINDLVSGKKPYSLMRSRKGDEFKGLFNAFKKFNEQLIEKNECIVELQKILEQENYYGNETLKSAIRKINP